MVRAITIKELKYVYPTGTGIAALDGINLAIEEGECVAVLGPNGSGKSTLLYHIDALLHPTEGEVSVFGLDTRNEPDKIRQLVGLVFQDPDDQLFAPTVWDDVAFGPRNLGLSTEEITYRVSEAIKTTGLEKHIKQPPHTLSCGQKKLACLAGVLAVRPKILLLDEPTSSLDPKTSSRIMRFIKGMYEDNPFTLIIATHDVDSIPLYSRRILVMDCGCIVCDGTPSKVFHQVELIRKCRLRLPRIAHLFEILHKEDGLFGDNYPLTIGEARRHIVDEKL